MYSAKLKLSLVVGTLATTDYLLFNQTFTVLFCRTLLETLDSEMSKTNTEDNR